DLELVRHSLAVHTTEIEQVRLERDRLLSEIDALGRRFSAQEAGIARLRSERDHLRGDLDLLRGRLPVQDQDLDRLRRELERVTTQLMSIGNQAARKDMTIS